MQFVSAFFLPDLTDHLPTKCITIKIPYPTGLFLKFTGNNIFYIWPKCGLTLSITIYNQLPDQQQY